MGSPLIDHYRVLGVDERASTAEIRSAFLRLIRIAHPDAAHSAPPPDNHDAAQIVAAYRCLRDPAARAHYNRERRIGQSRALVLVQHHAPPRAVRSGLGTIGRIVAGLALALSFAGALYLLAQDRSVREPLIAEPAARGAGSRVREQLRVEAGLDVEWVTTMHGRQMLAPLSRQCFAADAAGLSRAQCAYCLAFDDAAAVAVPGDAYFGDAARADRRAACPT